MFTDNSYVFTSRSAALTADGQIGNEIDFGTGGVGLQFGGIVYNPFYLVINVLAAGATAGGTGRFRLATSDSLSSGAVASGTTNYKTLWDSPLLGIADLTVNTRLVYPFGGDFNEGIQRYLALLWDEVATMTALRVRAELALLPYVHTTYPDATN